MYSSVDWQQNVSALLAAMLQEAQPMQLAHAVSDLSLEPGQHDISWCHATISYMHSKDWG